MYLVDLIAEIYQNECERTTDGRESNGVRLNVSFSLSLSFSFRLFSILFEKSPNDRKEDYLIGIRIQKKNL